MRIFKNKWFTRYARRENINDASICQAVAQINLGVADADLGSGVIKQRIARPGDGKSGGFRVIILFKLGDFAFFVYGFAKSERGNIAADELKAFKKLALAVLNFDSNALAHAITEGALIEVFCEVIQNEEAV